MVLRCARRWLPLVSTALIAAACATANGVPSGGSGSNASNNTLGTSSNSSGQSGSVSGNTFGSSTATGDDGSTGDACQHLDVQFVPKIPLVYVLADRSGSSFNTVALPDGGMPYSWDVLRDATLPVINSLQSQVAFAFGAYTGINPNTTPGMCPILDTVPVALNNYSNILAKYQPGSTARPTFKAETPATLSLAAAGQTLLQAGASLGDAGTPGGKYILWVTDGETDFCDDGSCICPADAVIAEVQKLYTQGIQTLILGLPSSICAMGPQILQAIANAGAGVPTVAPPLNAGEAPASATTIYQQCNGRSGWNALLTAAGLPANSALATYSQGDASATDVPYFRPDATSVADLTSKISSALQTVKSCSFDLQGKIQVIVSMADQGRVAIDGASIPYDATNGWTMASATQLDLVGTACDTWRKTGMNITFDFPCQILIPPPR